MTNPAQFYFLIFFIASALSSVFLVLAKKISQKYNLYDDPGKDSLKRHIKPISLLGGGAMLCSFLFCLALIWILSKQGIFHFENAKIIAIFVGAVVSWFYGFWDDTYWQEREKITQKAKIFLQIPIVITLALIFFSAGIKYQFSDFSLVGIGMAAALFIFIQNAVNLQDGLDGLASGAALISSAGFFIFFIFSHNIFSALVASALAGAIFSFLIFNWNPASIFMGNNGSYFLGFAMAALALMASTPDRIFYSAIPYLFLASPIINVIYVFLKRWSCGKSFFAADRNHIHDGLFQATKSVPKSVLLVCLFQLIFTLVGLSLLVAFK
jgi:UDP-GlcNAc:undecaprenyl-phosphate GlcNAc-1-phosphate transferase